MVRSGMLEPALILAFITSNMVVDATAGVDAVLGLDYKFKAAPVNLSVDWQPSLEFSHKRDKKVVADWLGLAVRYAF